MTDRRRVRRGTQRATMTEVARAAGVSASTVSLYLREPEAVSPKLRQRVQQAIDSLRYVPNRMAGALAAAHSRVVGVVVPSLVNSFFADTVTALQERLMPEGYQLLLGHTDYDLATEEELVRTFLSWSPAGMVLTGLGHSRATRRMLEDSDVPVVEMWELGPHPIDMLVGFSHAEVGRMQTRHLIEAGARNIAFIGARLDLDDRAAQRAGGYRDVLDAHSGMAAPEVIEAERQASSAGAAAFAGLIARRPDLDGVVFSNDILALGARMEAARQGIAVPDQVRMIGFGGLDFTDGTVAGLSTVAPPRREIGRQVAELLLGRIVGEATEDRVELPVLLTPRASSGSAAPATESAASRQTLRSR